MRGRRAFPYSVEAEEQAALLPGRRKAKWRDRPRHFSTLEAAGTFAAKRAAATGRRQHVRLTWSWNGDHQLWTVQERDVVVVDLADGDRELIRSLNRMEREA